MALIQTPQSTKRHVGSSATVRPCLVGKFWSYPHSSDDSHHEWPPVKRCYERLLVPVRLDRRKAMPALRAREGKEIEILSMPGTPKNSPQRTTTMMEPVKIPVAPAPATARPIIRAGLLCAVAHTRDLDLRRSVKLAASNLQLLTQVQKCLW